MRTSNLRRFVGLGLAVWVALVVIFSSSTASAVACTDEAFISIGDNGFTPNAVCVLSGGSVHWTNDSSGDQTVTHALALFDSGVIPPGGLFSVTIEVAGPHQYSSLLQPGFPAEVAVAVTGLAGDPGELAETRIPALPFPAGNPEDLSVHPVLGDLASRTTFLVGFTTDATVQEANAALVTAQVVIVGGLPRPRILLVASEDSGDFVGITAAVESLWADPAIDFAAVMTVTRPNVVPRPIDAAGANALEVAEAAAIASSSGSPDYDARWRWDVSQGADSAPLGLGGNWGLEAIRAPQAWNLREFIELCSADEFPPVFCGGSANSSSVVTAVLDSGVEPHADLEASLENVCKSGPGGTICSEIDYGAHGLLVAGFIGATHNNVSGMLVSTPNSLGLSGVNPHVNLRRISFSWQGPFIAPDTAYPYSNMEILEAMIADIDGLRIVNISNGGPRRPDPVDWWARVGTTPSCGPESEDDTLDGPKFICTPNNEDEFLRLTEMAGRAILRVFELAAAKDIVIVKSAGNASANLCQDGSTTVGCPTVVIDATKAQYVGWVIRLWDHDTLGNPLIMVENMEPDLSRAPSSSTMVQISAPGEQLAHLAQADGYGFIVGGGTSSAAPHVSGALGLILAFDPDQTGPDLIDRITTWAIADTTDGLAPRVDAFAAMLSLPGAASALVDVNDESLDGNERVLSAPSTVGGIGGGGPGPNPYSSMTLDPTTNEFYRTSPDGTINMRDFRRFRDAWVQVCIESGMPEVECPTLTNPSLDGEADHLKKDLNFDLCVFGSNPGCPSEQTFNRFDFNGDGLVSLSDRVAVPIQPDGSPAADPSQATQMTDLEVMMAVWDPDTANTEGYTAADLPGLMNSSDFVFYADQFFGQGAGEATLSVFGVGLDELFPVRVIPVGGHVVYTLPAGSVYNVTATAMIGGEEVLSDQLILDVENGGSDTTLELCRRRLVLRASPLRLSADATSISTITAVLESCATDVVNPTVDFDSTPDGLETGQLTLASVPFDSNQRAVTQFQAGTIQEEYTIVATASLTTGAGVTVSVDATIILETVGRTKIYYQWQQQVNRFDETGSSRWPGPEGTPGLEGDCDANVTEPYGVPLGLPGQFPILFLEYEDGELTLASPFLPTAYEPLGNTLGWSLCIDHFEQFLHAEQGQPPILLERRGILEPAGGRVALTEEVGEGRVRGFFHVGTSLSKTLTDVDPLDDYGGEWETVIRPERRNQFDRYELPLTVQIEAVDDTIRLSGLSELSDLNYEYDGSWLFSGTYQRAPIDQLGTGTNSIGITGGSDVALAATMQREYLIVSRPDRSAIRYNTGDVDELVFSRDATGAFEKYSYCENESRAYQRRFEYISSASVYSYPGQPESHGLWRRNTTFGPRGGSLLDASYFNEYPLPAGPVTSEMRYSFVAIPYESEEELEALIDAGGLDLPSCEPGAALDVDFRVESSPAEEGDIVRFADLSSRQGNSIVAWEWSFGDGETSQERDPTHRYADDGDYTVVLAVADATGEIGSESQIVAITNLPPTVEFDDVTIDEGQVASMILRLTDPGETDQQTLSGIVTSTNSDWQTIPLQNVSGLFTFQLYGLPAGAYPLTATIRDKDQGESTATATLIVVGAQASPPTPEPPPTPPPGIATCDPSVVLDGEERAFLDELNAYRVAAGALPLVASPALTVAADRHATDMATNTFLDHIGSDGTIPGERAIQSGYPILSVDENVLSGLEAGNNVLFAWTASPEHNANLLNPLWNAVGIGRSEGDDWYWTADFGELVDCPGMASREAARDVLVANVDTNRAPAVSDETRVMSYLSGGAALSIGQVAGVSGWMLAAQLAPSSVVADFGPTSALWVSQDFLATGEAFTVRNRARDDIGGGLSASIDFGDGRVVTVGPGETIGHGYALAGDYEISLTSSDGAGLVTVVVIPVSVAGAPVDPAELPAALLGGDVDPTTAPDFNLLLSPQSHVMNPGSSATFVVSVTSVGGFADPVTLSVGALPDGVTASLIFGSTLTPTGTLPLRISVDADAQLANFEVNVTATSGDTSYTTSSFATLDFGLVPVCFGAIEGQVRDAITGELLLDAVVRNSIPVGPEARYLIDPTPVGPDNQPAVAGVSATAPGYLLGTGRGLVECDRTSTIDVLLEPIGSGAIAGRVTVGEIAPGDLSRTVVSTGEPIEGAFARVSFTNVTNTDADGYYLIEEIYPSITPLVSVTAGASGYWGETEGSILVEAGKVDRIDIPLLRMCFTGDISFTVRYADGTPLSGERVAFNDNVVTLDSTGTYVQGPVEMGFNNAPRSFAIESPHFRLPTTDILVNASIVASECGEDVQLDVLATNRFRNVGAFEALVVDRETREPVGGASVRFSSSQGGFDGLLAADAFGIARRDDIFIGYDDVTSLPVTAFASHADYYNLPSISTFITPNQTTEVVLEVLRRQFATVRVTVTDDVTGAPIEGARVRVQAFFDTDANGVAENTSVQLGILNGPARTVVNVFADGYWSSDAVITPFFEAGEIVDIAVEMLPVCQGATIRGTVTNAETGEPLEDALVNLSGTGLVNTDVFGRYEFTDVTVGNRNSPRLVYLEASKLDFITQYRTATIFCNAEITIDFGQTNADFGAIEGTVTDAEGNPLANVFIGSGFGAITETDATGGYALADVPLGVASSDREWTVTAGPDGFEPMTLAVLTTANQTVRLDFVFGENQAPTADAGIDQDGEVGEVVVLDGAASSDPEEDPLTFEWQFDSLPAESLLIDTDLSGAQSSAPTFTPDSGGIYTLSLVVDDGVQASEADTVEIDVPTPNVPPTAEAGPDRLALPGELVLLDGTASQDPDGGPLALTYTWSFNSLPSASAISDNDIAGFATPMASFVPDVVGDYTLELIVDDGDASGSDFVAVQVSARNLAPVAEAGPDQNVEIDRVVDLDGSASFDPDGDMISFAWVLDVVPVGSGRTTSDLAGRDTPTPSFTPDVTGAFVVSLVVSDAESSSLPDLVAVNASRTNVPPNAVAETAATALVGNLIRLDGSASDDPDGYPAPELTYVWSFSGLPVESALVDAALTGADTPVAVFTPDQAGRYEVSLTVFDGEAEDLATVAVEVQFSNVVPIADAGPDLETDLSTEATPSGLGSDDPDDGPQPLAHFWRFVSVPAGSGLTHSDIVAADTATPIFTPDVEGVYVLELEVFDGEDNAFDNMMVTVRSTQPIDVTDRVEITSANESSAMDRFTRVITSRADITIENLSGSPIIAPIEALFVFAPGATMMLNATGETEGRPAIDLSDRVINRQLGVGESVTFEVIFRYELGTPFSYEVEVRGVVTSPAANVPSVPVPEAGWLWMLGSGLLFLAWASHRRLRRTGSPLHTETIL